MPCQSNSLVWGLALVFFLSSLFPGYFYSGFPVESRTAGGFTNQLQNLTCRNKCIFMISWPIFVVLETGLWIFIIEPDPAKRGDGG